jgi:hypothetical protein
MGEVFKFADTGLFTPEQTRAMGVAFDCGHKQLNGGLSDAMREFLAQRIIETAQRGETDPEKMAGYALALLKL